MKNYYLSGFDTFRCIAAACPDSCCVGWDVVIDDDSAARYHAMNTALGQKIHNHMTIDEDGDTVFTSVDGHCPFLQKDGLCEIQCHCGEAALSVTCRRFPRIVQEYDDFTEHCLSLSCPEGARITLTAPSLQAPSPETDDPFLQMLIAVRKRMIALVQDRSVPLGMALCRCLRYAEQIQDSLYEGTVDPDIPVGDFPQQPFGDIDGFLRYHCTLDLMTETFRNLTKTAHRFPTENRTLFENMAVYYLYRYTLQAVEDGDILSKVQQMLCAVTFTAFADGNPPDTARLYSKEVEHSYENMEQLYEAFFENPLFLPDFFYGIWG